MSEAKKKEKPVKRKGYKWGKLALEVVVVFLGVTAGFILNNWRNSAHDRSLEKNYVTSFLSEVNFNTTTIENNIKKDSLWLARAEPLLRMIEQNQLIEDSTGVVIELIGGYTKVMLKSNTYQNITNSGSFSIIRDFDLRESLVDHYTEIEGISILDDYLFAFYNEYTIPFLVNELSFISNQFINPNILQSAHFSNIFVFQISLVYQKYNLHRKFLEKSLELRDLLTSSVE